MRSFFPATRSLVTLACLLFCSTRPATALHHWYKFSTRRNLIAPIGPPFGFLSGGHYQLRVEDFYLKDNLKNGDSSRVGKLEAAFFLKKFDNEAQFTQFIELAQLNHSACVFEYQEPDPFDPLPDDGTYSSPLVDSAEDGILLSMKSDQRVISYDFQPGEEGLYFLMYQVCPPTHLIRSKFKLHMEYYNFDRFGTKTYLPAGEMDLPVMFLFFSISYLICFLLWAINLCQIQSGQLGMFVSASLMQQQQQQRQSMPPSGRRPIIYAIHHFMSVLLLLKCGTIFIESVRYHFIRIHGHAEGWTFIYYAVNFFKGMFLFTMILLIGSGWSFVKPFLQAREKKVILAVLLLQVLNNLALAVLSQKVEGEGGYDRWTAVLHLVDIVCCCAVLIPIVWQVNALEKDLSDDEEKQRHDNDGAENIGQEERKGLVAADAAAATTAAAANGGDLMYNDQHHQHELNMLDAGEKAEVIAKLRLFRSFYLLVVAYIYFTRILIFLFATMLDYQHIWLQHFVIELVTLAFYVVVGVLFHPRLEHTFRDNGSTNGETELVSRKS